MDNRGCLLVYRFTYTFDNMDTGDPRVRVRPTPTLVNNITRLEDEHATFVACSGPLLNKVKGLA